MNTFTLFISFFFCVNLNAQNGKLFLSIWNKNGNAELNVPSDEYSYLKKGKLYYFISNDNVNIYFDMKIEDPEAQTRILKQGFTIWVNMDNKLTKKMGIRFTTGSQNSEGRNKPNIPDNNLITDVSPVGLLSLASTIELIGFKSEEARRFPADNSDNFRVTVRYSNEGILHFRMTMPIAKLPIRNSKDGDGAMPFTFGIEYGPTIAQPSFPPVLLWIKNIKLATDK
jgi:hypothetical protein